MLSQRVKLNLRMPLLREAQVVRAREHVGEGVCGVGRELARVVIAEFFEFSGVVASHPARAGELRWPQANFSFVNA
jgi:hypothetical protein